VRPSEVKQLLLFGMPSQTVFCCEIDVKFFIDLTLAISINSIFGHFFINYRRFAVQEESVIGDGK
jgi:hypothetical protein